MNRKLQPELKNLPGSVFDTLGVRPVINCCGIYTDLGGSVLSPAIWQAVTELNSTYVRMTELLDATGQLIAGLTKSEAARVTPGASAAIALAVGATMTGEDGNRWEQLPDVTGLKHEVVIAASHIEYYKYAVCARMTGARLVPAGFIDRFDLDALRHAISPHTCCIFVPAHLLDGFSGVAKLCEVAELAHDNGLPLVVDAAYMSYPTDLIAEYSRAGADLTCFSAKYFGGPNSGGFVMGKAQLIRAVEGLDFTRFESGRYRKFGRAFKMSRYDVAATALALQFWMRMDHRQRWAEYADKVQVIFEAVRGLRGVQATKRLFSMSEELLVSPEINCVVLRFPGGLLTPQDVAFRLEAGNPIIATIPDQHKLIVAVDALLDGQEYEVASRLTTALSA